MPESRHNGGFGGLAQSPATSPVPSKKRRPEGKRACLPRILDDALLAGRYDKTCKG